MRVGRKGKGKRPGIWFILVGCFLWSMVPTPGFPMRDLRVIDEDGMTVTFPKVHEYFTQKKPGPWKTVAALHFPHLKHHFRKYGLEQTRVVQIEIPHPLHDKTLGTIEYVFMLDKDDIVVGYKKFADYDKKAGFQIVINSAINYFQIYVFCSKHGVWKSEIRVQP